MESSFLSAIFLPLALAIIMVGIGLELKPSDFGLLLKKPKPIVAGLSAQMILLPILGIFVGMYLFSFTSPLIGAGFVILALSPGGSTSNLMTLLAKGDLALSVTLTAFVSIITPLWLPFAASVILKSIPETQSIELDLIKTFIQLFVITVIPITIGMILHAKAPELAKKLSKPVKILATVFLFLIIIALVVKNWIVIEENYATVGLASLVLVLLTFLGGFSTAKLFATTPEQVKTITFEVGIQNGTLTLLITATILGISEMTLAAIFYSLIMFLIGFMVILIFNRKSAKLEPVVAKVKN